MAERKIKVKLSDLKALQLHDTSQFMDGQDPMLVIKIGSKEWKTDRYESICCIKAVLIVV